MQLIGQNKILEKINKCRLENFPRTLMLVGKKGSGKHLISDYISKKLYLQKQDISTSISVQKIDNIMISPVPKVYLIDTNQLNVKGQNVILKFIEQPLKNAYIILLCENKSALLDTVINRCQIWQLQEYSKQDLSKFVNNKQFEQLILQVADTPGQVLTYEPIINQFDGIKELCIKIFEKIQNANFANVLTIPDKIAFKQEKDKYNKQLFYSILLKTSEQNVINNSIKNGVQVYLLTNKLYNDLKIFNINERQLLEEYLYQLRNFLRNEK